MDYQVSARKYRPGTFVDVIGQPHVVQTLMNAVDTKRIAHAYLFSGTRGVGKTTVARILAKALNCEQGPTGRPCNMCVNCQEITQGNSVDVIEIDGASNTSVDDVREIRENVKFTPFRGQYRVYIIDEVHMLSNSAFNALLKTLEEPPPHVVFIFATTEIHKIPATILSRCQHYNFRRIARAEIIERLRHVADQDGLTIEPRSLTALARASEGSMRDALSLLDQAVAFGGKTVGHADLEVLLGAVPLELVGGMIRAILAQDSPAALAVLAKVLDQGHDLKAFCAEIVEHLRNLLVASVVPAADLGGLVETSEEDLRQLAAEATALPPERFQDLLTIFAQAEDALRLSAHPRFVLEAAAVRATRVSQTPDASVRPAAQAASPPPAQKTPAKGEPVKTEAALTPTPRPTTPPVSKTVSPAAPAAGQKAVSKPPETPKSAAGAVAPPASVPAGTATIAAPTLDWESVQEEVAAAYPNIAPFLEAGRFVGLEGGVVTIGFAKQVTSARAMLEKEDNLKTLAKLCERQTGHSMRVRVVELSDTDSAGPTMAQIRAAKEQDQRLVLFDRVRSNPVVKQALEMFGAELADVRTVPQKEAE
ncbi:DNA polymerase III subunit gamma/tau [Nitrospira moscoviensis]|uniref:DNA polymerase III subunit gamma/tau n=1 Tax=Nitrospira moscoviensis TaxID=42253 RepID=A0A0K2G706_NITMO|nr:DNA polymerase III subunit gamma/tau [Nitrospira moscoviensis]ALA56644.1 DNA polymerase III [Nitrospira moscoviensis]